MYLFPKIFAIAKKLEPFSPSVNILGKGGVMMIKNQRRPYIQSSQPEKTSAAASDTSTADEEKLKSLIVDSLKALTKNIDDLKQSVKALEERFDHIDITRINFENELERLSANSRTVESDLLNVRNELEIQKREAVNRNYLYNSRINMDRPMMPGTGFACVTPNYLKNRQIK